MSSKYPNGRNALQPSVFHGPSRFNAVVTLRRPRRSAEITRACAAKLLKAVEEMAGVDRPPNVLVAVTPTCLDPDTAKGLPNVGDIEIFDSSDRKKDAMPNTQADILVQIA